LPKVSLALTLSMWCRNERSVTYTPNPAAATRIDRSMSAPQPNLPKVRSSRPPTTSHAFADIVSAVPSMRGTRR
jgi:hypothetical protein